MVRCGSAKNYNNFWECRQICLELQKIVKKYENYFNGEPVVGIVQ